MLNMLLGALSTPQNSRSPTNTVENYSMTFSQRLYLPIRILHFQLRVFLKSTHEYQLVLCADSDQDRSTHRKPTSLKWYHSKPRRYPGKQRHESYDSFITNYKPTAYTTAMRL